HSKAGMAVQWLVGIVLGAVVTWLTSLGLEIPPEILERLTAALVAAGVWLVTALVQGYQTRNAKALQQQLGVKQDGWIGPKTLDVAEAAKKTIAAAKARKP
ncbi:hypothetical protein, partial [Prosthecobacter algae]|uniref:hypothetical protein n=1 Tax=Prosthecobacter algae TaxID=1144682 RepID=UPI003CD0690C